MQDTEGFCTRCGHKLPAQAAPPPPPPNQQAAPPPPPAGAGAPPPQQPPPAPVPPQQGPVAPPPSTPNAAPPPPQTTQSAPPPPATPGPAAPPPPQPGGQSKWWIWLIVAIVVIGVIVGLVWWVSSATRNAVLEGGEKLQEEIATSVTATATPKKSATATPTPTPTPTPVLTEGPDEVVTDFLNMSLGTLPTSNLNLDAAWQMLSPDLRSLYPDSSYLPLLLCIQDGPSDVSVSEATYSDLAYVDVQANYGGTWINMWQFELDEINGEWKIVAIRCLSQ